MFMLMVFIVAVRMLMFQRLMLMLVVMSFGEVQPKAQRHHQSGRNQRARQRLLEQQKGKDRPNEGRQ